MHPRIILLTGNMASGKSTVAQALAERLPQSVHLRGDVFRRMIVRGRAKMSFDLPDEARQQLQLRYDLAVDAAKRYVQAGFTVVYQDILIGEALTNVLQSLQSYGVDVVVLCPRPDVVAARDRARAKTGYSDPDAIAAFDRILRTETPRVGYWLDNSDLNVAETVENIVQHLNLPTG